MPNWCENKLQIIGETQNIIKFMEYIKGDGQELSFNKIIPEPATAEDCPEEYVIHDEQDARNHHLGWDINDERRWFDWYHWRYTYWGVKWNCSNVIAPSISQIKRKKLTSVNIYFNTPWGPAEPIMEALLEKEEEFGLKFKFMWYEPGCCFKGKWSDEEYSDTQYVESYDEEKDEYTYDDDTEAFMAEFNNE